MNSPQRATNDDCVIYIYGDSTSDAHTLLISVIQHKYCVGCGLGRIVGGADCGARVFRLMCAPRLRGRRLPSRGATREKSKLNAKAYFMFTVVVAM